MYRSVLSRGGRHGHGRRAHRPRAAQAVPRTRGACRPTTASTSTSPPVRSSGCSATTARASRRWSTRWSASCGPTPARITLDGDRRRRPPRPRPPQRASIQAQANVPITGLTPRRAIELVGRIRGGDRADVARRTAATCSTRSTWAPGRTPRPQKVSGGIARLTAFAMTAVVPGPPRRARRAHQRRRPRAAPPAVAADPRRWPTTVAASCWSPTTSARPSASSTTSWSSTAASSSPPTPPPASPRRCAASLTVEVDLAARHRADLAPRRAVTGDRPPAAARRHRAAAQRRRRRALGAGRGRGRAPRAVRADTGVARGRLRARWSATSAAPTARPRRRATRPQDAA